MVTPKSEGYQPVTRPHVQYPHEPGRLFDCPGCESECFCGDRTTVKPVCCHRASGDPLGCHTECIYCLTQVLIASEVMITYREGDRTVTVTAHVPPF